MTDNRWWIGVGLLLALAALMGLEAPRWLPTASLASRKDPKTAHRYTYQSRACGRYWKGRWRAKKRAKERLSGVYERLKALHHLKCAPKRGDWLAFQREPGRSFARYARSSPNRPTAARKKIYIQPLGRFSKKQRKILALTAAYVQRFFSVPVKLQATQEVKGFPRWAKRRRFGSIQLHTRYLLGRYLPRRRPKDAVAYIAFTSYDLWPGKGWNFVYGEATLRQRIGVWSLHRMGSPNPPSKAAFMKTLRRALKIAVHELGHIFSIYHCVAYECVMNGANHMGEVDSSPLALCPIDLKKLCWNTRCDLKRRIRQLLRFCTTHGLKAEARYFKRALAVIEKAKKAKKAKKRKR